MKKIVFILVLILSSISFAQTKYLIYFKDKGQASLGKISGSSEAYKAAVQNLSERAIERRKKVMGENIITYEDIPISNKYVDSLKNLGIKIQNKLRWFNAVSAYLTADQLKKISGLKFVEKVEKVGVFISRDRTESTFTTPAIEKSKTSSTRINYGPSYTQLALSDVPVVHMAGINGNGIIIGILDSGFRWKTQESLSGARVLKEYDFVFHDSVTANQPGDDPGQDNHGTHVFSMVGGYKEGKIIGSAYGASFILAKTEDIRSETHIEEDNYAAALEWMEGLGVDVTTSSLGYNVFDSGQVSYTYKDMNGNTAIVTKALNFAFDRGIVTVTAAGNEGNNPSWLHIIAPADAFNAITVGAVSSKNTIAAFSSHGPTYDGRIKPDIVAQGVSVFGADPSGPNIYNSGSGTSFATPIASGITALLLSAYPYLTNVQVLNIIHMSGDKWMSPDTLKGWGLLSAQRAVEYPNIEVTKTGGFVLHKAFLDTLGVQTGAAKVFISTDGINYTSIDLNKDTDIFYKVNLAGFNNGQIIRMYFTFTNSAGQQQRQPNTEDYQLEFGNKNIITEIENSGNNIPTGYTLYQNYPNPFNNSTTIVFDAPEKSPADVIIYNLLGQQIKHYSLIAQTGKNIITWDSANDKGVINSSGVYFYVLKIAGKSFSRKMILLR